MRKTHFKKKKKIIQKLNLNDKNTNIDIIKFYIIEESEWIWYSNNMSENKDLCPCGSGKKYGECCEPIIKGKTKALTAEALMRAFVEYLSTFDI